MSIRVQFGQRRRFFDARVRVSRRGAEAVPDEPLLPAPAAGKPTLVLDLDQTLVYIKCTQPACILNCGCGEGREFYIAKRPGVAEFLDSVAKCYEVVLWTASPQFYADSALAFLDPEDRIFSHRLYGQHLVQGKKDLSRLGRELNKVVAVDDCSSSFPSGLMPNVFVIDKFIADGSRDAKLGGLARLLTEIAADHQADVRQGLEAEKAALDAVKRASVPGPWRPSWCKPSCDVLQDDFDVVVDMPLYVPPDGAIDEEFSFGSGVFVD